MQPPKNLQHTLQGGTFALENLLLHCNFHKSNLVQRRARITVLQTCAYQVPVELSIQTVIRTAWTI